MGFAIGHFGGYRLLLRYGRYIRLDEPKVKVARYLHALLTGLGYWAVPLFVGLESMGIPLPGESILIALMFRGWLLALGAARGRAAPPVDTHPRADMILK